jgi:phage tail-like protein
MALLPEDIAKDYPLPVYNYRVSISGTTIAFSEVSGLEKNYDPITYKECREDSDTGTPFPRLMYMPGQLQPINISLKKGLVVKKSVPVLWEWLNSIKLNRVEKKDIIVSLCDETGTAKIQWTVIDCFPTKISAPSFDANSNDVAIESLDLMATNLEMKEV